MTGQDIHPGYDTGQALAGSRFPAVAGFKVGKKNRIDDPGSWQRMLVLTNSLQWPTVFGVGTAGTPGVEGGCIWKRSTSGEKRKPEPL